MLYVISRFGFIGTGGAASSRGMIKAAQYLQQKQLIKLDGSNNPKEEH